MPSFSSSPRLSNQKRFFPLRYRFVGFTTALLILVLGLLAITLGYWQSRTIKDRLKERGMDIAAGLSATSVATLINYNYVVLEQLANEAAQDPEIVYVIVHDKEGRIAGYSARPDLQHKFLEDTVSRNAIESTRPLVQKAVSKESKYPVLDVALPVVASQTGIKWGTIRVGLSFGAIYRQVRQLTAIILMVGVIALGFGVLMAFGAARHITRPMKTLMDATIAGTQGRLHQDIDIHTGDEIEILADNFSSMMREIFKHKEQLEARLAIIQHMQKYTDKLLSTMNDGLLSFSMDGRVNAINPAARKLLSLPSEQPAVGDPIWTMVGDQGALQQYVRNKMTHPSGAPHDEIRLEGPAGEQIVIIGSSILEDRAGDPEEVILNLHDITEQKRMEARVRQAERLAALGTLAAGMAHEIRNPLSAIKTFVQLLPRKLPKPGFLDKFNRTVPREINRINMLVEDLLDLARKPRYTYSQTDIRELLIHNIELVEEELTAHGIQSQLQGTDRLPPVSADKHHLNKAFQNLIRNAFQAMPGGGRLVIETRWIKAGQTIPAIRNKTGDWIAITFEDTGIGIDEETISEIFNPFFTSKDQGTGLGLAITHKVVTEHGGHIEASSQVGKGTRFTIYLKAL